jgi:acetamidase/formamidase
MGVAPVAAGSHSTVPPRRVGGNMDVRLSSVVAELRSSQVVDAPNWTVTAFFPVAVLGAV